MADMKVQDVVNQARFFLNDETSDSYLWRNEQLVPIVNYAVTQIVKDRPDALYNSAGALITIVPAGDISSTLSIDDKWLLPAAFLIASLALSKEAGQVENQNKAKFLMSQYVLLIKS